MLPISYAGSSVCPPACQHPTTQFFTGLISFLPPNQQRQSPEGNNKANNVSENVAVHIWQDNRGKSEPSWCDFTAV